jgi:transposase
VGDSVGAGKLIQAAGWIGGQQPMTRPYSQDLRERAVALVASGQSRRAVARLLDLGESTVIRWTRRQAVTGSCAAKPMGGVRHAVLLVEREWLLARIAAAPDFTLRGLRAELGERGTRVSYDTVWRFVRNQRLTFKKKPARRRAGSA